MSVIVFSLIPTWFRARIQAKWIHHKARYYDSFASYFLFIYKRIIKSKIAVLDQLFSFSDCLVLSQGSWFWRQMLSLWHVVSA